MNRSNSAESVGYRYHIGVVPRVELKRNFLLILMHIPLALLMFQIPAVATIHALIVLLIGIYLGINGARPEKAVYLCGYIVGAEVLWRMCGANVFWEFGKYATVLILGISLLSFRFQKGSILPLVYFVLLIPSILYTVVTFGPEKSMRPVSFNISGPLALAVCAFYFSKLWLSVEDIKRTFLMMIAPIAGIGALCVYGTVTASRIVFSETESVFETSGGFGPNQVSAVLGLGALLAYLLFLAEQKKWRIKVVQVGLVLGFTTLSILTFSRGGFYMALLSGMLATLYFVRKSPVKRIELFLGAFVLLTLSYYVLIPRLESFTGNKVLSRFQNLDSTGRDEKLLSELRTWTEYPILGVGPGGYVTRNPTRVRSAPHTEFSRLLAHHGVFGLCAFVLLIVMAIRCIRRVGTAWNRGIVASLIAWSFLFMLVNAMRLVAPAFLFGLGFAAVLPLGRIEFSTSVEQGRTSA